MGEPLDAVLVGTALALSDVIRRSFGDVNLAIRSHVLVNASSLKRSKA